MKGNFSPSLWHVYHRSDIYLYLAINWTNYVFLAYIFKPQTLLIRTPPLCVQSVCCATGFSSIAPLHSPPPWPASLVQLRYSCITVTASHGLTLPLWLQIATQASVVARWCSSLPSEASVSWPFSRAVSQSDWLKHHLGPSPASTPTSMWFTIISFRLFSFRWNCVTTSWCSLWFSFSPIVSL